MAPSTVIVVFLIGLAVAATIQRATSSRRRRALTKKRSVHPAKPDAGPPSRYLRHMSDADVQRRLASIGRKLAEHRKRLELEVQPYSVIDEKTQPRRGLPTIGNADARGKVNPA